MKETNELKPGETYLFTKEILAINLWFPRKQKRWIVKVARKNIGVFLLPVGKVLSFTLVRNKLSFVIEFHSREVLEKVPRRCRDQIYELTSDNLETYVLGELGQIAAEGSFTYAGMNLHEALRKRLANFLQSLTLQYNRQYDRKDRLSARYSGIFELESEEDIKRVLAEMQNMPLIHWDNSTLEDCHTNSFHLMDEAVKRVISYKSVMALFGGSVQAFQDAAREVRRKLEGMSHAFRGLEAIPPGRYLIAGMG